MKKLQFNVIYELNFSTFHVPYCTKEQITNMCSNGSFMSHINEAVAANIYNIIHQQGNGYDYPLQEGIEKQLDQKTFSKKGLKFMPSYMIGKGRKFNKEEFDQHVLVTDYIITDITNFPMIRFVIRSGIELAKDFPKGSVSLSKVEKVFKPEYERIVVNEEEINPEINEEKQRGQKDLLGSILHKERSGREDSISHRSEVQLSFF